MILLSSSKDHYNRKKSVTYLSHFKKYGTTSKILKVYVEYRIISVTHQAKRHRGNPIDSRLESVAIRIPQTMMILDITWKNVKITLEGTILMAQCMISKNAAFWKMITVHFRLS